MSFTDTEYQGPPSAEFLNYKEVGKHTFRFMGDVHTYDRYWLNNKPYVYETDDEIPPDVDRDDSGKAKTNHMWSVVAIKMDDDGKPFTIGALDIQHSSVQKQLMDYYNDSDYGDFCGYNVVISRKGTGLRDTKYKTMAKPPKPPSKEMLEMYEDYEPKDLVQVYSKEEYNKKPSAEEEIDPAEVPDLPAKVS